MDVWLVFLHCLNALLMMKRVTKDAVVDVQGLICSQDNMTQS